ncbi:MAG: cytochrome P450 [Caulobacterales bacterium]
MNQQVAAVPSHVDPSRVHFYDIQRDKLFGEDPYNAGFINMRDKVPGVFWTPANGGHWVVQDPQVMDKVLRTPEFFSNKQTSIPAREDAPRMIPESLDPPEHLLYRGLMMTYFEPKSINKLEGAVRERAETMIRGMRDRGTCEFVEEVAGPLPIKVFMQFAGFPLERYDDFRALVTRFFGTASEGMTEEDGRSLGAAILTEVAGIITAKQADPSADDMLSFLIKADFQGRKLQMDELMSIVYLLFIAGLDTVTNAMSFGVAHMARHPEFQQELRDNPSKIPAAVDELLRRYTFTHTPRLVVKEVEIGGVTMKAGDMIWNMLPMYGLNEALNPDPLEVKLDRPSRVHGAFSTGGHICLGRHLAKMELRLLYEVMLRELPMWSIDNSKPEGKIRGGVIMAMPHLWLRW